MNGRELGGLPSSVADSGGRASSSISPLPQDFFARPAERVAPELVGCVLEHCLPSGVLRRGVIVETEAYCQSEAACHGHRRRSPSNETLFGDPGRFYVYVSYGIHHCVNVVTGHRDWANGVLLRAVAVPGAPERIAAGPALLARHFDIDRRHDGLPTQGGLLSDGQALRIAARPEGLREGCVGQRTTGRPLIVATTRIGIRQAQDLPWRWYLAGSRSVSRRQRGDRTPARDQAWDPESLCWL